MNRLTDFHASTLDALTLGGELAWGRFARRTGPPPSAALSRNGPVTLAVREDVPSLLDPPDPDTTFTGASADVLAYLESSGASFMPDIVRGTRRLPSEVEEALWLLVAAGRVTADGFGALRGLVSGVAKRVQRRSRWSSSSRVRAQAALGRAGSRWSLLQSAVNEPEEDVVEARAAQLLRRYGVMLRELLAREPMAPPWGALVRTYRRAEARGEGRGGRVGAGAGGGAVGRSGGGREPRAPPWGALVRTYRRAEARGEVRGGRFVAGPVGEQFALPEAVDALRAVHRRAPSGEVVRVSGSDPLNLVGVLTPGQRVPSVVGNSVLYRDGVPVSGEELGAAAG